jgi:ribosome-interacting GTPase 1
MFKIKTVARTCNLIFIVLDVLKPLGDKTIIESELEGFGIRLNRTPPNITVRKKDKGGKSNVPGSESPFVELTWSRYRHHEHGSYDKH